MNLILGVVFQMLIKNVQKLMEINGLLELKMTLIVEILFIKEVVVIIMQELHVEN